MLTLERTEGRSVYVGHDITLTVAAIKRTAADSPLCSTAEVVIVAPGTVAWTFPDMHIADHARRQAEAERDGSPGELFTHVVPLAVGEGFLLGRGIRVRLVELTREGVRLGIMAPRHVAISRDDFSIDEHRAFQAARDAAPGPAPGVSRR